MPATLSQRLLWRSPTARAWFELLDEGEILIVTWTPTPDGERRVLRTTVDIYGNVACQVCAEVWDAQTPAQRGALAAEHRARLQAAMAPLVAPERAIAQLSQGLRLVIMGAGTVLAGGGGVAIGQELIWAIVGPIAVPLLWAPARWVAGRVVNRQLQHLVNAFARQD